jgi:hypothetical protein
MRPKLDLLNLMTLLAGAVSLVSGTILVREARVLSVFFGPHRAPLAGARPIEAPLIEPLAPAVLIASLPANASVTDQVKLSSLMAPDRSGEPALEHADTLLIETRYKDVSLRGGPGTRFPVIATARHPYRYLVADFKERWFKIALPGTTGDQVAWVRSDQVRVVEK